MSATVPPPLPRVRGVAKCPGGVHASRGMDPESRADEVHAPSGENGAGKSTPMDVLPGVVVPDRGAAGPDGRASADARGARAAATVLQERDFVTGPGVAADPFLGREPPRPGRLDERRTTRDAPAWGMAPVAAPA